MNNKLIKTTIFFVIPSFCILHLNNTNKFEEAEAGKIPIEGLCDVLFSSKKK